MENISLLFFFFLKYSCDQNLKKISTLLFVTLSVMDKNAIWTEILLIAHEHELLLFTKDYWGNGSLWMMSSMSMNYVSNCVTVMCLVWDGSGYLLYRSFGGFWDMTQFRDDLTCVMCEDSHSEELVAKRFQTGQPSWRRCADLLASLCKWYCDHLQGQGRKGVLYQDNFDSS